MVEESSRRRRVGQAVPSAHTPNPTPAADPTATATLACVLSNPKLHGSVDCPPAQGRDIGRCPELLAPHDSAAVVTQVEFWS